MEQFDIIIIGGGPAGTMAALHAAKGSARVCLIERKDTPGMPVRCGEGIGHRGLTLTLSPKPEWIKSTLKRSVMISPGNIKVAIGEVENSYILDRERMDGDLFDQARAAGVTCYLSTTVLAVKKNGTQYECTCNNRSIAGKILICADGVESRIARFTGWKTNLALKDLATCAFTRVKSNRIDHSSCTFFIGSQIAPGGYAWIFPRSNNEANVGLGILGSKSTPGGALKYLQSFIAKELPDGSYDTIHCGGVPVTKYIEPLVREGVMLVGDAARQVNALSGGGIAYSLYAGKIAGTVASEAIHGDSVDYKHLRKYEHQWKKSFGKQQKRSFALKEFVRKVDDSFLDRVAGLLAKENPESINYRRIFVKVFRKHPVLLIRAIRLFT